jgi:hypothetical protein
MKSKPKFFIIGAPKGGTTSLNQYLRAHPDVFVTRPKEARYFADDLYRPITTIEVYAALFKSVTSDHHAIGEASATYLLSQVAAGNIREFAPHAKLIAMVRNPVQMIPSLHSELYSSLNQDEKDLEKAWQLQDARKQGRPIQATCQSPIFLQYAYAGRLGAQLERLFQVSDRKLVKVIAFDDFVTSTKKVYEDTLAFLGVPSDGRVNIPRFRANTTARSRTLSRFIRRLPRPLMGPYLGVKLRLN